MDKMIKEILDDVGATAPYTADAYNALAGNAIAKFRQRTGYTEAYLEERCKEYAAAAARYAATSPAYFRNPNVVLRKARNDARAELNEIERRWKSEDSGLSVPQLINGVPPYGQAPASAPVDAINAAESFAPTNSMTAYVQNNVHPTHQEVVAAFSWRHEEGPTETRITGYGETLEAAQVDALARIRTYEGHLRDRLALMRSVTTGLESALNNTRWEKVDDEG